ncbi:ABC transporter ATP-binding protein [Mesorhizobium australicum]|uniref:Amino acid/amide ABC transporter ATP-binding protein 2, HAAT family n=1 Tax=Mesorhizobium australicum TaxID=536018 RepID=A0A1X7N3B6_9HYPH|nr:ABC transporter ATP-binding protein [Mesorhizobium australicum]SMH30966.1 amino acid/amide ABC transporter ATP-binding protein 2, HAAT family [Mesorhizobium australicum]
MAAALEVKDLEVVYQGVIQALTSLSLTVQEGAIVTLLGANGAGKTTTLKAISGFLPLENGRVTRGSITIGGQDLLRLAPHQIVRRGIFQVREGRHVFSEMTVEENLVAATFAQRKPRSRKEAFDEVYNYFPILSQRRGQAAGYLSGGEQQMLAIGRALVADPEMILLDEPSLGLAPLIVKEIFEIIARINREKGVSMLLVEQNAVIALKYASYGYVIESGRTVLEGTTEKLSADQDIQKFYLGVDTHEAA